MKLRTQRGFVQLVTHLDEKGARHDVLRRRQALQRSAGGHQQHIDFATRDEIERFQPLRHQILVRRNRVVRQRLPIRQHMRAQFGREPLDLVLQSLCVVWIGADDCKHAKLAPDALTRQPREKQGIARAGRQRETGALAGFETGAEQGRGMGHAGIRLKAGATNAKRAAKTRGAYYV